MVRSKTAAAWRLTGLAALLALSACGGGGGGGGASTPVPPPVATKVEIGAQAAAERGGDVGFSASGAASGATYAWTFGDGTASAEAAPRHAYAQAGLYEVTLSVTAGGTTSQAKHTIAVNDRTHVQGLPCSSADSSGWCWQDPQPSGHRIQDIDFSDANNGWTAGWGGEFMKTTDGGATWQRSSSGQVMAVRHVSFVDARRGWGLTWEGTILNTTDGGQTWGKTVQLGMEQYGGWIRALSPSVVIAVQNYTGGVVTTDGGNTWTKMALVPSERDNAGRLWEKRVDDVLVSTDNGLTARTVLSKKPDTLLSTLNVAGSHVHVQIIEPSASPDPSTWPMKVSVTTDGGATWSTFTPTGIPNYLRGLTRNYLDENVGWVDEDSGTYRTVDGGRTWSWLPAPRFDLRRLFLNSDSARDVTVRAVPDSLDGYFSVDGGGTWRTMQLPFAKTGFRLKRAAPQVWHALSNEGALKVSEDDMKSWRQIAGPRRNYSAFWFFDDRQGVALSDTGEAWNSTDGGRSWQAAGTGYRMPITVGGEVQMRFSGRQFGWALDLKSQSLRISVDGGKNWEAKPMGDMKVVAATLLSGRFGYVQVKEDNTGAHVIYAVGGDNYVWQRRGTTTYPFQRMAWLDENRGVGVTLGGQIEETSDGGKTWNVRYNSPNEGSLMDVIASPAKEYWVISNGQPLRSSDGITWKAYSNPQQSLYVATMTFLDNRLGWASGGSEMYATRDGGATWTRQQRLSSTSLRTLQFVNGRVGWGVTPEGALLATGTGGD